MRSERHMGQQIVDQLYLAASQKRAKPGHVRLIKLVTKRPTNKPTAASLWAKYEAWDTLPNIVPPEGYVCAFASREDFQRHMPDWRILQFMNRPASKVVRFVVLEVPVKDVIYRDQQALVRGGEVVFATI